MKVIFNHAANGRRLCIVNVVTVPQINEFVSLREDGKPPEVTYRVVEVEHVIAPSNHAIIIRVTE